MISNVSVHSHKHLAVKADVTSASSIDELAERIVQQYGEPPSIVIHAAGLLPYFGGWVYLVSPLRWVTGRQASVLQTSDCSWVAGFWKVGYCCLLSVLAVGHWEERFITNDNICVALFGGWG